MDVYQMITDRVVESLNRGTVPWQKPWQGGKFGQPRNFVSTKAYRGINVFLLSATAEAMGYTSPFWISYKQAQSLGGSVKKGEKSSAPVVFYSQYDRQPKNNDSENNGETEKSWVLRYTPMFNTDQTEGLKVPDLSETPKFEHEIIATAQAIVDGMPNRPMIHDSKLSDRAYYRPSTDTIAVPEMSQYKHAEEFYSTLFHELGHSTGHESRLNRDFKSVHFADHEYSKEELVAEFTASYLCAIAGIESRTIENSAAYIDGWLKVLKDQNSRKWLTWGASNAQKAADYIQGINIATNKEAA